VAKLIALMRYSFVLRRLSRTVSRKSAIEKQLRDLAIDAFLGKAKAIRKLVRLERELEDVRIEIARLRVAAPTRNRARLPSAIGACRSEPAPF
jgi:hypothetical protein